MVPIAAAANRAWKRLGPLPRREWLEDKVRAARPFIIEEGRALQLIALGNRVVLENVAPAAQPPTMLRVTRHHKQGHVGRVLLLQNIQPIHMR
jgi:hypothetical protein